MGRTQQQIPIPRRDPRKLPANGPGTASGPDVSNAVQIQAARNQVAAEQGFLDTSAKDVTPTFEGFEDDRFQMHDERIEDLVSQFNSDKSGFIGANPDQVTDMTDLDPALVKSWIIQETGGGGKPWQVDPAQANNPGDWTDVKKTLGLSKPRKRNTGDADTNLRASIALLARKGFSTSGRPPSELQGGQTFGGWTKALTNYNGNNRKVGGKRHKELYAQRILGRAANPETRHRIPLGKAP